ncbi:MAG: thioredoxin family protein [Pirellulaceae bacterium]
MNKIVGIVLLLVAGYLGIQMASSGGLSEITGNYDDEAFAKQVEGPGVVLVKFGANWCGPCRMMDKELENVKGHVKIVKINVDHNRDLSRKFRVSGIPHTVLFKNGKPVGEKVGFCSANELSDWARQYGSSVPPVQNASTQSSESAIIEQPAIHKNPFAT